MRKRYRLFLRGTVFWCQDNETGKQESLRTKDRAEAQRLFDAKNEAHRQPIINLHIARAYLMVGDPDAARRTPERWLDSDELEFHHQLQIAAGRFKRTELAFIGTTKKLNGHACRIALTKSDGSEVGDLVDWDGLDENRILPVEGEIREILSKHGRHGLAAAMRAIWTELNPEANGKESK